MATSLHLLLTAMLLLAADGLAMNPLRVLPNHRIVPTVDVVQLFPSSTWHDCVVACEQDSRCKAFTWAAKWQRENSCSGSYRCILYERNPSFSIETAPCSAVGLVMEGDQVSPLLRIEEPDTDRTAATELSKPPGVDEISGYDNHAAPRLCLNMIVKNEGAIIERSLHALAPWIDYYVIVDTGSSDDTVAKIQLVMNAHGVSGEVHHAEFRNFEYARNLALTRSRDSRGDFEYILLCDADMEFHVVDPLFRTRLSKDVYLIKQKNNGVIYDNVRVIKRSCPAKYVGSTHEYVDSMGCEIDKMDEIWYYDHANGASRPEKYVRDERLLKEDLAKNPNNTRAMFYLAQTYREMKNYPEAIRWYRTRSESGGWDEEVFYAKYQLAFATLGLGDDHLDEYIAQMLEAWNYRPQRAEPLYHVIHHYRLTGKYELASLFAERALRIPVSHDSLFVEHSIYTCWIRGEMAIAGYYSSDAKIKELARNTCFGLSVDPRCPDLKGLAAWNQVWHVLPLKRYLRSYKLAAQLVPPSMLDNYVPMNPVVWFQGQERYCLIRTVNYRALFHNYHSDDGTIRTENYIVKLGKDYSIEQSTLIKLTPKVAAAKPTNTTLPEGWWPVLGFEDARLIPFCSFVKGRYWLIANSLDWHARTHNHMYLLELDQKTWETTHVHHLNFEPEKVQKNWVPFVRGADELLFVYWFKPFIILKWDFDTHQLNVISNKTSPLDAYLSGTSPGIPYKNDGWLYIAHEKHKQTGHYHGTYLHRWVHLGADFTLRSLSAPFVFHPHEDQPRSVIEFCSGLTRDPLNKKLVLSFGDMDKEAWIVTVDEEEIDRMLLSPDDIIADKIPPPLF